MRDDECVLLPSALTCRVEWSPSPPFESAPSGVLDGLLIENETVCTGDRSCPETTRDPVPDDCVAHAGCSDGRGVVIATGCERLDS